MQEESDFNKFDRTVRNGQVSRPGSVNGSSVRAQGSAKGREDKHGRSGKDVWNELQRDKGRIIKRYYDKYNYEHNNKPDSQEYLDFIAGK